MPLLENDAARLRSLVHLLTEGLRIADEGDRPIIGAQISGCLSYVQDQLALVTGALGEN